MAGSRFTDISPLIELSGPPEDATRVFIYSPTQQRIESQHGVPRSFYQKEPGVNLPYTEDMMIGPDPKAQMQDFLKRFPDGRVMGYGNEKSHVFQQPQPSPKLGPR